MTTTHLAKTDGTYYLDAPGAAKFHQISVDVRDNTGALATPAAGTATITARAAGGFFAVTGGALTLSNAGSQSVYMEGLVSEFKVVVASLTATYTVDILVRSE